MKTKSLLVLAFVLGALSLPAFGQGTSFTYQGQLSASGGPATGSYDLTFSLFTTSNASTQVGSTVTNLAVGVSNGLFTTIVDFGQGIFTGPSRWLEIGVRSNGVAGAFTPLGALQDVTATPYAVLANSASNLLGTLPSGSLSGTYTGVVTLTNSNNNFTGNGGNLANVNAAKLGGLAATGFWQTTGNAGTSPTSGNYVGTSDNNALELHVNGARALRLEPGTTPNVIGGYSGNIVNGGLVGGTIGGGGASGGTNRVAGAYGTVGGGINNTVSNSYGTVSGGLNNVSAGLVSTVGGGYTNAAGEAYSTVGGGQANVIQSGADHSVIGGGEGNVIQGTGFAATIAGGNNNTNNGNAGTIAGGQNNLNDGAGYQPAIGGGYGNVTSNSYATIGGGISNTNLAYGGTIGGGQQNVAGNFDQPTVGGGYGNLANNSYATVPGGSQNVAGGEYSFAAGQQAQALHLGTFVWADSQSGPFSSTGSNQFLIRAEGGVGINTQSPLNGAALDVEGSAVGGFGSPMTFIQNSSTAANASPALRVIGHGTTPNGVLSVSSQGTGLIAQFGNAIAFVSQLDTNGNLTANSFIGNGSSLTGINATTFGGSDLTAVNGTGLNVGTNIYLNDRPMYLRNDKNHALAYCGAGVTNFPNASVLPDGPVLWGFTGGALAVANTASAILSWTSSGVSVAGSVTATSISGSGAVPWQVISGASVQAASNDGYLVTSSSQVTVTLPSSPNVADVVRVSGVGSGGWKIAQNSGQQILGSFSNGTQTTSGTGGSLTGTQLAVVELQYAGSGTFIPLSQEGTISVH